MKEIVVRLYDEARSAWRYRWFGLALAVVVALVGWTLVFALRDRYEAKGSVFVDSRTALRPALQGLTVEQDVNTQLNLVRQSLLSGQSLERIARASGVLPADAVDPKRVAAILQGFANQVRIDVRSGGGGGGSEGEREKGGAIYSFAYRDTQRERALSAVETMTSGFIEGAVGNRRAGTESAQKFLEEQIRSYETKLRDAETKLADFKKANVGLMPTQQGGYFERLQIEIDDANKLQNALMVAEARRDELARQLRGEATIGAMTSGTVGPGGVASPGSDTLSRIKETQARIDDLLQRFTEKHPDVIAARNTLRELNVRRDAEIEGLRRGEVGAAAASGASANPVYQNIMLQLNQAEVELASMRNQLAQHQGKATELRQKLDIAPQVEAQFAQLNRDYDINKAQYTALLGNYEKARLGERADDAGSVRFEVVQPAMAPYAPVSPPRLLLLAAVFVAAFGAGAVLSYALHLLNPVIGSLHGLQSLLDVPVFGVVSSAFPDQLRSETRRELLRFIGACLIMAVLLVVVVSLSLKGFRIEVPMGGASR
jgi:polysaccharide chain length determinant protein (PEP-CTERM system associated)